MDSSPAVSDGIVYVGSIVYVGPIVYVGSDDDYLYALEVSTGDLVWRYKAGGDVNSSAAIAGGVVYVGSRNSYVYAIQTGP